MQLQNKIQAMDFTLGFLRKYEGKPESSMPWAQLDHSLTSGGMNSDSAKAFVGVLFQAPQKQNRIFRVLHELEKDMITTEAHGLLIEAIQLGILSLEDSEPLLEKIIQTVSYPIDGPKFKVALLDHLLEEANKHGFAQIH